jgi:hypothetical protein
MVCIGVWWWGGVVLGVWYGWCLGVVWFMLGGVVVVGCNGGVVWLSMCFVVVCI